jgi:hypothetical protein
MHRVFGLALIWALVLSCAFSVSAQAPEPVIPDPTGFFGFTPGEDRRLLDYSQLVDYIDAIAAVSDRVAVEEVGRSTLGRPMKLVLISASDNLSRLDRLKAVNRRLALDPSIPDGERQGLIADGRVFVMATLSMHSTEVAPAQSLPVLIHQLATADDPVTLRWLGDVVVMVVACLNPDGMDMIVEHYRSSLGTDYEGGSMPGLYHHFVGHDNNRDFVALTQAETGAVSRIFSTEWYPHVLLDKHQMGRTGPRYFVPRYHDPIAENIDGELWTWSDVFGSAMAREIGRAGLTGVASNWVFDEYWPGSTTTSHWKGVISLLTEAASCRLATPIFVEKSERRVRGKGLSEYKKSVNMPSPWPGGWWRLGDIVRYELASWRGALDTASLLRAEILSFRNDLCRKEVAKGRSEAPYYYVLPHDQHDASERDRLVDLLGEHGVAVHRLEADVAVGDHVFAEGDAVVTLAQPYRAFIKEVMEDQRYPVRHYTPGGEVIRPYDITSWSLPRHMGVRCIEVNVRSETLETSIEPVESTGGYPASPGAWGIALDPRDNASYEAVNRALGEGSAVRRATQGLELGGVSIPAGAFVVENPAAGVVAAMTRGRFYPLDGEPNGELSRLKKPRIALIETWFHDMDAGWTRYLFQDYGIDYTLLRPGDVETADLVSDFDVVVIPDADTAILTKGKHKRGDEYRVNDYRPEYREAIGADGIKTLQSFLEHGGLVISWGRSTTLLSEGLTFGQGDQAIELELPVRDTSEQLSSDGLYVPGSLLGVELIPDHPLTWGLPPRVGVFSRGRPVLETSTPLLITDRRVVGFFPEHDILLSGYAERDELLAGRPAMVWVRVGRGQIVLFGFQPQFRASTPATYKLLFNALLLARVAEDEAGVAGVSR